MKLSALLERIALCEAVSEAQDTRHHNGADRGGLAALRIITTEGQRLLACT